MPGMPDIMERFAQRFPEDLERRQILELRWPLGFTCPECRSSKLPMVTGRRLLKCRACRRPIRITMGTLFDGSRVPLTTWFKVIGEMTRHSNPVSASQLSRELGLRRQTVLEMMHQLRLLVRHSQRRVQLHGRVQVDELATAIPAEQTSRNAGGIFVAVEVRDMNEIGRVALRAISDFGPFSLVPSVQGCIKEGSIVETDGLAPYRALKEAGYDHRVVRDRAAAGTDLLPACRVVAAQVMRWLGTVYGSGASTENLELYLAEFAFRLSHAGPSAGARRFVHLLRLAVTGAPPAMDAVYTAV